MVNLQLDIPCSRVVEIPAGLTLADLHRIVQHLFYWQGYHLHEFRTPDGMPLDIILWVTQNAPQLSESSLTANVFRWRRANCSNGLNMLGQIDLSL